MAIGLTEDHEALAASVRGFTDRHITTEVVREGKANIWPHLAQQGLLALHLPEEYGGQGFGLVEQAVALEQLGRALTPGPYLGTVLAGAIIARYGTEKARKDLLPALAGGERTATVVSAGGLALNRAELYLSRLDATHWTVTDDVTIQDTEALDLTRPVVQVAPNGDTAPQDGAIDDLITVLLGAEACGVAARALEDAVAYAKLREQFGRKIGQFQGIKHKCARMLIAVERARAAVWDAARALDRQDTTDQERAYAVAVAGALAADAAVTCAEGNIQVHGGIGYTFEHDAHLIYRRALTLRALTGRAATHRAQAAKLALDGVRREIDIELPEDAQAVRAQIRAEIAALESLEMLPQRAAMAEGGWVTPHLPKPWGRAASPVEQIVIQQELKRAGIKPVPLMIAAWVVPSLVQYGTPEQQRRFLPPTLRGEIVWCQLFSEPGAGSDLAALSTRAERVEGGWRINGQKIWTSLAREAQWGICIARTDPDAPKHKGITYFLVDMADPGIEIRPLRECTGDAVFNEVFLDNVFVPDDRVVGPVNEGWRVARNTLANERVGLTSTFQLGGDLAKLIELARELGLAGDPLVLDNIGGLAADEHAFRLLGLRATLKQLSGTDPGATANVRKLVAMEHGQQITEYGYTLLAGEGALTGEWRSPLRRRWTRYLLASRAMTIGGGTTEVNLNVIGERILGLPRDPEPVKAGG
jgi:alkylation response protein AidB-like acyl-CoA dehydrogenase